MDRKETEAYMRSHDIQGLFESLLSSVVILRPDDPIQHLLDVLRGMNLREGSVPLDVKNEEHESGSELASTKDILAGCMDNLPPMASNVVRVFLSSTFSDFKAERTALPRNAYPELQKFCNERGLDFQVVDMRWGVTDEIINDHMTSAMCVREISLCKQLSQGPYFVAMLGNRYGYQPLPATINANEFTLLSNIAREKQMPYRVLLDQWYHKDENAVPAVYCLQSIPSRLRFYNDHDPENVSLRNNDRRLWNDIFQKLQKMLQKTSTNACEAGLMEANEKHKYYISVTEEEIQQGILLAESLVDRALCYTRNLQGLKEDKSNVNIVKKYIDLDGNNDEDTICSSLLEELEIKTLPKRVPQSNRKNYVTVWTGNSLETSKELRHLDYLDQFCKDFIEDMKRIISEKIGSDTTNASKSEIRTEVLHHGKFCKRKCEIFCGQEDIIQTITDYLRKPKALHGPLVIHGRSGFGKTTILAHVAYNLRRWISAESIIVVRFLGTSPKSSSLKTMILSVAIQLCEVFDLSRDANRICLFERIGDIKRAFWTLLQKISEHHLGDRSLVIILDSIDQLSEALGAHQMLWLPKELPPNVFVVLSMLSDRYTCLESARKRFTSESNFIEIHPLPLTTGKAIVNSFMAKEDRQLTIPQEHILLHAFQKCSQPLFLKLLLDDAKTWKSYVDLDTMIIPNDVHDAVSILFQKLEDKYGAVFVSSALGLITCGQAGLTEVELEDALSCDNDVLNEVYLYHDPPLPDIIRVPPLMWSRLQYDVSEYLVERQADGKTVISWYHRVFWEAAEKRYLQADNRIRLHSLLAEIFRTDRGIRKTITLDKRSSLFMENADRQISLQPMKVSNLRKLNCLPYHLFHSHQLVELKDRCLLNFRWLMMKLKASTISYVLSEYDTICSQWQDDECLSMRDFLYLSYEALQTDPHLLAYQTLERLDILSQTNEAFSKFMLQAKEWVNVTDAPLLISVHPTEVMRPAGPLRYSLTVGNHGLVTSNGDMAISLFLEKKSENVQLQIWDLDNKDMIESISTTATSCYSISGNEKKVFLCENGIMRVFDLQSGDLLREIVYCEKAYDKWDLKSVVSDSSGNIVVVGARVGTENLGRGNKNKNEKRYKYQSAIFVIDIHGDKIEEIYPDSGRYLQKVFVTPDDQSFISIDYEQVCVYDMRTYALKLTCTDWRENSPNTFHLASGAPMLVGCCGGFDTFSSSLCLLNYIDGTTKVITLALSDEEEPTDVSNNVDVASNDGEETIEEVPVTLWHAFDLFAEKSCTKLLVGLSTSGNKRENKLMFYDVTLDKQTLINIEKRGETYPKCLCAVSGFHLAVFGWQDGVITVVDVDSHQKLVHVKAHEMSVNYMKMNAIVDSLYTIGADRNLKVWNIQQFLAMSLVDDEEDFSKHKDENGKESRILTANDQVVNVVCSNELVIIADSRPYAPPTFWNIHDGTMCRSKSNSAGAIYHRQLYKGKQTFKRKMAHLMLDNNGEVLIDIRKRREEMRLHLLNIAEDVSLETHFDCSNPYLVMDNSTIAIPCSKHMDILDCKTGKQLYTIPISTWPQDLIKDRTNNPPIITMSRCQRYVLFANVVSKTKYMEVIDLEAGNVISRAALLKVPAGFLENSFYFLLIYDETNCEVLGPNGQPKHASAKIKVLLKSRFLSFSGEKGIHLSMDGTVVEIWNVAPLKRLHVLPKNRHKVHTITFSSDDRFLICGSYCTASLWHVESGVLLHNVHAPGAICDVLFSPNLRYVLVHCYAGPKHKRVIIHRTHHLELYP